MRNKELTAATRTLTSALADFGVSLSHQQAQHVLARVLQSENCHVLTARLNTSPHGADLTGEPLPGILVQVSADYVPEDGDAFDAVQAALEHFEIPAFIREGTYIRRGPIEAVGDKAPPVAELPLEDQRRAAADKAFERYDFGSGTTVEDSDGWEFVSGKGPRSWRCSVFLSFGDSNADSRKALFEVTFADKSAVPVSAQATLDGVPVGCGGTCS